MRAALLKMDRGAALRAKVADAMSALGNFARALQVKFQDVQFGLAAGQPGVADSGDLERDLTDLMRAVGNSARAHDTALVLFIDELQYVSEGELAALIVALHNCAQNQLPVSMVAAGLPQLVGISGRAKSYAERLFEFVEVDRLTEAAARDALGKPVARESVAFATGAMDEILIQTRCYPYFLQEWGKHAWDCASATPIAREDVERATQNALAELDQSFFRVRFDRLTPLEKKYMRAMADLGAGPHRSGDIAERLGKKVTSVAPLRNTLIAKGMIFSPTRGDTAFTVPLFEGFMKRIMP